MCPWLCVHTCVCPWMSTKPYTYFLWKACLHGQIPSSSFCLNSSKHTAHIWKEEGELEIFSEEFNSTTLNLLVVLWRSKCELCVGGLEIGNKLSKQQRSRTHGKRQLWPTSAKNLTQTEQKLTNYVLLYNSDLIHTGDLFSWRPEANFSGNVFPFQQKNGQRSVWWRRRTNFFQLLFPRYET